MFFFDFWHRRAHDMMFKRIMRKLDDFKVIKMKRRQYFFNDGNNIKVKCMCSEVTFICCNFPLLFFEDQIFPMTSLWPWCRINFTLLTVMPQFFPPQILAFIVFLVFKVMSCTVSINWKDNRVVQFLSTEKIIETVKK